MHAAACSTKRSNSHVHLVGMLLHFFGGEARPHTQTHTHMHAAACLTKRSNSHVYLVGMLLHFFGGEARPHTHTHTHTHTHQAACSTKPSNSNVYLVGMLLHFFGGEARPHTHTHTHIKLLVLLSAQINLFTLLACCSTSLEGKRSHTHTHAAASSTTRLFNLPLVYLATCSTACLTCHLLTKRSFN